MDIMEKNSAAKVIQKYFRKNRVSLLRYIKKEGVCLQEPIIIGDENVSMYLKTGPTNEQHLFNIFNFKVQPNGIRDPNFFINFYNVFFETLGKNDVHTFYLQKNDNNELEIYVDLIYSEAKYKPILNTFFFPYLLYIFANNKIDLDEGDDRIFKIEMFHPYATSDNPSGIHKDNTVHTCLTYVDSPLSTELAFDVEKTGLHWLTCSPIFRFDTSDSLYTLCFNDQFILHTIPIFEEEGKLPEEVNEFEPNYKMRENGEFIDYIENGELERRFLKPEHRQKIAKYQNRKVLACFIESDVEIPHAENPKKTMKTSFPISVLDGYRIQYEEEKIELSEDAVRTILTMPRLGKMRTLGGRKRKNKKTRKVKRKNR
jgi:hypothetical protein